MLKDLSRIIYPRRCPGCGDIIAPDSLVCEDCNRRFKLIKPPYCMRCGRHVYDETIELCENCAEKDHHYIYGVSVFEYDSLMKLSMSRFKFYGWQENADFYVQRAVEARGHDILAFRPDALIPVPVHPSKRAYRGYNQAELLAEGIGKALNIRVVEDFLVRTRRTGALKKLGKESREENLRQAFTCESNRYRDELTQGHLRKVLLVDDIYTTGSTMEGCTKALLLAGVESVGILSISIGNI